MRVVTGLKQLLYSTRLYQKFVKPREELDYWRTHIESWIPAWFLGTRPLHFPFPTDEEKENSFDLKTNAVLTYIRAELRHQSYLKDLGLAADIFRDMRVADIGCGPFPTLLVFEDCERWGFDHLVNAYRKLGYPLGSFDMRFVNCKTERIPVGDAFFDAVVSRNALDHVDDFETTAAEIQRILKPGAALVIQTHYHTPTPTEPLVLNDERVLGAFGNRGIRKVSRRVGAWGFPEGETIVWSNIQAGIHAGPSP